MYLPSEVEAQVEAQGPSPAVVVSAEKSLAAD